MGVPFFPFFFPFFPFFLPFFPFFLPFLLLLFFLLLFLRFFKVAFGRGGSTVLQQVRGEGRGHVSKAECACVCGVNSPEAWQVELLQWLLVVKDAKDKAVDGVLGEGAGEGQVQALADVDAYDGGEGGDVKGFAHLGLRARPRPGKVDREGLHSELAANGIWQHPATRHNALQDLVSE